MCLFELWFSQGICPVVGLLGHLIVHFSFFKGPPCCSPNACITLHAQQQFTGGFPFHHSLSSISGLQMFLMMTILTGVRGYFTVVLICISAVISLSSIFSGAYWPSVFLLWRNVYLRSSAHFSIGLLAFSLLSFMNCLYILEIKPLLVASFANIFSRSVGCLFVFVYGFLCCAKA